MEEVSICKGCGGVKGGGRVKVIPTLKFYPKTYSPVCTFSISNAFVKKFQTA